MNELARCVGFLRTLEERHADRRFPLSFGDALLNGAFPRVWDLNFARVDATDASAGEIATAVESVHAAAGQTHRKLVVDDRATASRLRSGLEELGWVTEENVVMTRSRPPDRPGDTSTVREVAEDDLQEVRRGGMAGEPWAIADPASVDELLAVQHLHDRCVTVRRFAAYADGRIGSYCDLYLEDGIAQVESVMTVPELRNRGLARAVVSRAVEAAREDGARLVFLVALEDDWPRELYRKLGFDAVGRRLWAQLTPQRRLDLALEELLAATGASRVTLRRPTPGDFFPVTNEALAAGVESIADGAGIDLRGQPVVVQLAETRAQVVQHHCATAFADPAFHTMREAYGGLASQIVTPIHDGDELVGIVSLHQCGEPRTWTDAEIALAAATADRVKEILSPRAQPLAP